MKYRALLSRVRVTCLALAIPALVFYQSSFWQSTNGPNDGPVTRLAVSSQGHLFAMCNYLYRSTDNGNTWTKLSGAPAGGFSSLAVIPNDYILGGSYGAIFRSTDDGDSWRKQSDVHDWYSGQLYSVTSFAVTPDSLIYAGTWGQGFYESFDLGHSWTGGGYYPNHVGDDFVRALATSAKGYVFVGTDAWILRQDYNGHEWGSAQFTGYGPGADVTSLVATPRGYVFASSANYSYDVYGNLTSATSDILRSTEDSVTFSPFDNGLPTSAFTGKYLLTSNSAGDVFAGNDSSGVYRSTDNGLHWAAINGGLQDLHVQSIAASPSGYVFVGTSSGLVYRSSQPTTGIVAPENSTPEEFTLEQNFPNPFNPATTIRFSVPTSSFVTLKVHNLLGEEITTLVSERLGAGTYTIRWDANTFPSGVYFCRLQAGDLTETKKLTLLR